MATTEGSASGWLSIHQRLKGDDVPSEVQWRIRDMEKHPADPAWEDGTYSICHEDLRSKVASGEILFDCVHPGNSFPGPDAVVRSAMRIIEVEDGTLRFDEFWFLDGPFQSGISVSQSQGHAKLAPEKATVHLEEIKASEDYSSYTAGNRPASVPDDLWEEMLYRAGKCSESDDGCPPC